MAEEKKNAQSEDVNPTDETPKDNLPENKVDVAEAGTLKKKVTITISRERIDAKRDEMFGELSSSAQVPGFRIGRAPRRLLEKRFGKEVGEDVRNSLIGESIGDAIEKSDLKTIGEPDLDLDKIEMPETGELEFSFEVEVAPEFDLPELKGIEVEKAVVEVTDAQIDDQLTQWAEQQAKYEDTDKAAAEGDIVVAGATIKVEGLDAPTERPGLTLRVAPGQVEGLPLVDLGKELAGKKAEQTAKLKLTVPDSHPNEDWQGKEATVEIHISQVRQRILPEINDAFAEGLGFDALKELRVFLRDRFDSQMEVEVRRRLRQQIEQHLLDGTEFELPEGLVQRHTAQLIQRRTIDLLQRGVPRERIEENVTELKAAASEQADRDLKLQFIVGKVADDREITVSPAEVNSRIAQMAAGYGRRPERLRQELAADGSLGQLESVLLEEKTIDSLLQDAKMIEKKPGEKEKKAKKTAKKAAEKTEKKTEKKAAKKSAEKTEKNTEKKAAKKSAEKTEKKTEKKAAKKAVKKATKSKDK